LSQRRDGTVQTNEITVRWGRLPIREAAFELPDGATLAGASATLDGSPVAVETSQEGRRVRATFPGGLVVEEQNTLAIRLRW
jgi:hypothetical protein